ncbi:uncharacterized protein LOC131231917 isoform X3 [Magnolia sinica]|uniref:uncharacterized protein LOC131231917 isoform X3 n=1 Tax=Magnolia sinica TaxID=86752 RepID=UPI002657E5C9|nr:uncharacterized protein LOC131231917 isoform X3 [Magnolia sinica]
MRIISCNPFLVAVHLSLLTCLPRALADPPPYTSLLVSSFSYPESKLKPFEWRYIRVELPPWFSSMAMTLESDADFDEHRMKKLSKSTVPMMCLRDGSPPLPDVSETSMRDLVLHLHFNGSVGGVQNFQGAAQCFSFQKNTTVKLTNEQISPGVLYIGFFNGIGPARTQSKMISRGPSYTFRADISIEGCITSTMWGPFCNQSISQLSCVQTDANTSRRSLLDHEMYNSRGSASGNIYVRSIQNAPSDEKKEAALTPGVLPASENVVTCTDSHEAVCLANDKLKIYSLEIVDMTFQLKIMATDIRFNQTSNANVTENDGKMLILCYARHDAMPLSTVNDYSGDISRVPLIIQSPKIGRWYIAIHVVNQTSVNGEMQEVYTNASLCFSLELQVDGCPLGKAGPNCTWEKHMLQRVLKKSPLPFESYYLPIGETMFMKSANFPVEPLLSNSSFGDKLDVAWTYFLLDVPRGAAGANIHVQLVSDAKVTYGIYARFGGIPSLGTWDYYFNGTSSSNGSMFLALNDSSEGRVNFYILYAKEGTWTFGLRHLIDSRVKDHITMSFGLEGCPRRCSSQGTCHFPADESGLTFYSYCSCDRDHGGFDCSIELVTRQGMVFRHDNYNTPSYMGHIWQSIVLIASNAAAILPAFWALRQKFMDFWLSFMAVVSTFVYMATIDEVSKRAIHTTVAILTALMAATNATRSENIIIIVAIGILGLLVGWLIEFSTANRFAHCSLGFRFNILERWQSTRGWLYDLMKTLQKRFRWPFIFLGSVALSAAGISWKLENSRSYWIWHSMWHITMYTASFLFLCSTSVNNSRRGQSEYELTRQNSSSRGNSVENAASATTNGLG